LNHAPTIRRAMPDVAAEPASMKLTLDQIAAKWFVRPGDVVLDIGSYTGETAGMYLERGAALVCAFEPRPAARDRMPAALRADPRFRLYPYALGDSHGPHEIVVPRHNDAASSLSRRFFDDIRADDTDDGTLETVELRRIDDLDLPSARFWKIDVEGSELEVLKGARKTLAGGSPASIQVEVFLHNRTQYTETRNHIRGLFPHFWAVGFSADGKMVLYAVNSETVSSSRFHDDLRRTGTPRYFASHMPLTHWLGMSDSTAAPPGLISST